MTEFTIIPMLANEYGVTNSIYIHEKNKSEIEYIKINNIIFKIDYISSIICDMFKKPFLENHVALNTLQRQCSKLTPGSIIQLHRMKFKPKSIIIISITIKVITTQKNISINKHEFNENFKHTFVNKYLSYDQQLAFDFKNCKFQIHVIDIDANDIENYGIITYDTNITCEFATEIKICDFFLKTCDKIINTNVVSINTYKLETIGIGGLDDQFSIIFRRAFLSRTVPLEIADKMKLTHVKGIILHGPPGTGKTLLARKIGEILNCASISVVNGPELMSKYVGESANNVRNLFINADADQASLGANSPLHLIIFDEFDSIAKRRDAGNKTTDDIVNQLLTKIDGITSLNNILLIGMTNRLDLIDDALLRSGRFEVNIEINLPDENGREEILKIHTKALKDNDMLNCDVNLRNIATITKNYSGAELEGLVKNARAFALHRHTDLNNPGKFKDNLDKLSVNASDFKFALTEIKPLFGQTDVIFEKLNNNIIIDYGHQWQKYLQQFNKIYDNFSIKNITTLRLLLHGFSGCGKSTVSSYFAKKVNYPYIKILTPINLISDTIYEKINKIKQIFFDAHKSQTSIIILDDIERIIEFSEYKHVSTYSNPILQTLLTLLNFNVDINKKLIVICTTSNYNLLDNIGIASQFNSKIELEELTDDSIKEVHKYYNVDNLINNKIIKKLIEDIQLNI